MFLHEEFDGPRIDARLRWMNEPARWRVESSALVVAPDAGSDFWRRTHYGFEPDSGHFLFAECAGGVVLTTHVRFRPVHQYDQAGLMIRIDADCWLKTSVEYELEEAPKLSVVVTSLGYSDWSIQDFDRDVSEIWLRVRKTGGDCFVEHSRDSQHWHTMRIAHLHAPADVVAQCGVYACSPKAAGFEAAFEMLLIEQS